MLNKETNETQTSIPCNILIVILEIKCDTIKSKLAVNRNELRKWDQKCRNKLSGEVKKNVRFFNYVQKM